MPPVLFALALGALTRLGPFTLQPPQGFARDDTLAGSATAALAPSAAPGDVDRRLLAFFRAGGARPATFAVSKVEAPLAFEPSSKAALAAVVESHFSRELDLPFTLERTRWISGAAERIEIWGSTSIEGEPRELCVAFFPGRHRHAVAVASLPASGAPSFEPAIEAALASLRTIDAPEPFAERRTLISLAVWGAAGLALVLARLYRNRRAPGQID